MNRSLNQPMRRGLLGMMLIFAAVLFTSTSARAQGERKLEYNRDIRPIFAENCFACHGPDSASRKADLRIDQRQAAIDMKAFVPGKPDESEGLRRILSEDAEEVMPPPTTKKKLTAAQKETLRRWISEGAEYQPHWSLIPPTRPQPPAVKNEKWVRNPVDRFILAKIEERGLEPAPEADRRTIARRLSLDLIGLPPKPEDVDAFVNDTSPQYYETYVNKLMSSKHWGEHRGRYWLDYARYADTHGIHFDNFREIWAYRDWVINAFNRNLPYDQFTIEQLAGDLLPNATLDQRIASGFNRCNITTSEGGVIAEEYQVLYTRDRTETLAQVWFGTTANCAVCHDHKFDPLTMRDFYSMAAFFNNTTQPVMDGNVKDTPPIIVVPSAPDRDRWNELQTAVPASKKEVEARKQTARGEFDEWLKTATVDVLGGTIPEKDLYLHAPFNEGDGKVAKITVDGTCRETPLADSATWQPGIAGSKGLQPQGAACELADVADFEATQPFSFGAWVKVPGNDSSCALAARMDRDNAYRGWDFWAQRRQFGTHIVSSWPDNALKVVSKNQLKGDEWTHVTVSYDGSGKAAGVKVYYNGAAQPTQVEADKLAKDASIRTTVPFKVGQRSNGEVLSGAVVQDLRIYRRELSPSEIESLAKVSRLGGILAKVPDQRTDAEKNDVYSWWLGKFDKPFQDLSAKAASLEKEQNTLKARGTIAHVMQEKNEEAMAFVLYRGEYDKRRDPVKPGTPTVLHPFPADAPKNRLGLAQWILRPENPLTCRVTTNRIWQEIFGTGIVRTAGDFGVAGELPSHPELLDWLAIELRENGWDLKKFYSLLVTSATYRQAAILTPEKREKDPQNRLLCRGPRYRLDAETIRDYALAASGLLVPKFGGPSVKPYQPEGVWEAVAMIGSNTRDYRADEGDNLYRRSMYTFWKRSAPPASLEIFNAPSREFCVVRRERTNTPLQALVTLNDPQFVEAARALAQLALKSSGDSVEAGIDTIARRLLARSFRPEEMTLAKKSLAELQAFYDGHANEAKALITYGASKPDASIPPEKLAAWTMLTNELMNLDEALNK